MKIGDAVHVVDERYQERVGLVTAIHGQPSDTYVPCINVVMVHSDENMRDPYGQQLERLSSLQHESAVQAMPRPGRFYREL